MSHSPPDPFLSIVIPAYNEESRLPDTLATILDYLERQCYEWEIIVADDGSADATVAVAQDIADQSGANFRVLDLPHRGKGWAVRNGMLSARGQYRCLCDADLSMPIAHLTRLLPADEFDGADIAVGSREAAGSQRVGEPLRHHLRGRVFNAIVRLLAVPGIADTQCGFKVFSARAAQALFPLQTIDGFCFDVELLFLARRLGFSITEVGIEWHWRAESKVNFLRDTYRMVRDLLLIRYHWLTGHYQIDAKSNDR